MFTGRALIPVKVLKPFEERNPGDIALVEDWKAKVLWEAGVGEVVDETDKIIGEIDRIIAQERENEPLTAIPEGLYERAEFYIYYLENYVRKNPGESIDVLGVKMTKLANLKRKYRYLKELRFKKILEAVRLRPTSLEVLGRLSPEERRIYLEFSRIRNEWLGE
ncbi:hypothetical protein [Thermococcus zilligii]|uniref:hypothetical protein n=1 Tax=Thermococcus zilligii TaxID=54076 RepID=UPI00029A4CE0|nr:hypothetical protein [Thermococcus zilligii]